MRIRGGNWTELRAPVRKERRVLHQGILEPTLPVPDGETGDWFDSARQPIGFESDLWHSRPRTWRGAEATTRPRRKTETARRISRSLHPNIVSTVLPKVFLLPLCRNCL
jgi:hypothetical protein